MTSGGTVLTRILARLTGQDLREQLTQVHDRISEMHHQQGRVVHALLAQNELLTRIRIQIAQLETIMTDLDATTEQIVSALDDLIAAVGTGPADLAAALAEIQAKNARIAELQADDDADAEQIAALTAERDKLVTDSMENAAILQAATDRARAVVPGTPVPTDPPAEPVTDFESAPVDTAGDNA